MGTKIEKRVLWISRHLMTETQKADLERIMGGPVRIERWTDTVRDVEDLRPLVQQADAVAAVLPAEKLAQLMRLAGDTPVLQAKSGRVPTGRSTKLPDGRVEQEFTFVHQGWQQILEFRLRVQSL